VSRREVPGRPRRDVDMMSGAGRVRALDAGVDEVGAPPTMRRNNDGWKGRRESSVAAWGAPPPRSTAPAPARLAARGIFMPRLLHLYRTYRDSPSGGGSIVTQRLHDLAVDEPQRR
jgi:hypothetical protein